MTLREQLQDVTTRQVNGPFFDAIGFPRSVEFLAARAFKQNWDRTSLDARVVLRCAELLDTAGAVTEGEPGIPNIGVAP